MTKTNAEMVRASEAKKRASGLVEIRVWLPPDGVEKIRKLASKLCKALAQGEWKPIESAPCMTPPDRTPEEIVIVAYYATDPQLENPAQAIIAALASHNYVIVPREAVPWVDKHNP